MRAGWVLAWAAACLLGCGGTAPAGDGGTVDAHGACAVDHDCDDGTFCNGIELCQPSATAADGRGCVHGNPACMAPARCDEAMNLCSTVCDAAHPDADGDRHDSVACGGDDCDDADARRFPANPEVCDAAAHDEDCNPATVGDRDVDGDGAIDGACCNGTTCGTDCDDVRRGSNPSVPEVCDQLDNDCDGAIDEGLAMRVYLDGDHDGVGDASRMIVACPGTPGTSDAVGDCDDTRASVRPTAPEICDVIDNDCDGTVDEHTVAVPWYVDTDGDGWGFVSASHPSIDSCVAPAGRAIRVGDCDDTDPMVSPTAVERCNARDDDCNGRADFMIAARNTEDDDLDGVPDTACMATDADCNDRDPFSSHPTDAEVCDGRDNDCDTRTDEDTMMSSWYADMDGDRFGDPGVPAIASCTIVSGRTLDHSDCDDHDGGTHPGAPDSCTTRLNVDDDCDTHIDEGGTSLTVFVDMDDDGWGTGASYRACLTEAHAATRGGDCNDMDARVSPGALDDCAALSGVDDDCDMAVDETLTPRTYYADADGDGYGNGAPMSGCAQPAGTALTNDDCDDADRFRNPGIPDDCLRRASIDDDCDGAVDEASMLTSWYADLDGDRYGAGTPTMACIAPSGTVSAGGDCDDSNAMRNPGAPDDCSRPVGVDDDCDTRIDEAAMFMSLFRDLDGDGYGSGSSIVSCGALAGYVNVGGDCNESSTSIHPSRSDGCTSMIGVDDDCDGMQDEDVVLQSFYADADHDGYGVGTAMMACSAPVGFAPFMGDCDDANASRSPGRPDDCSGVASVDDDCDMGIDEAVTSTTYYRDADGDGYGDLASPMTRCSAGAGYVVPSTDCDDTRMAVHPGGTEVCANGLDDDCNTLRDCADSVCASGCGTLSLVSGDTQSAAVQAPLASALTVRITDGASMPLVGRTLSLVTTSVSATGYSYVSDALGQVTFAGLRAPFPLATETVRVQALGVPDLVLHYTASAPANGNILTLLNGRRRTGIELAPGRPAYEATANGSLGMLAGASDGSLYLAADERIHRIRSDGSTEVIAGAGCCGLNMPNGTPIAASSVRIGGTGNMAIALDETRGRVYFGVGCGIYYVDLATRIVSNFMGREYRCGTSGNGGLAVDAGAGSVFSIAVTGSGVVWFTEGGGLPDRNIRMIDTAGRISRVVDGVLYQSGNIQLDYFPGYVFEIPGSNDALLFSSCVLSGMPQRVCILRLDSSGVLTHLAGAPGATFTEGIDAHLTSIDPSALGRMLPDGSIVYSEPNVHVVRRISPTGIVTTIAGTRGTSGDTGDDGAGVSALLYRPSYPTAWRGTHVAFWQPTPNAIRAIW